MWEISNHTTVWIIEKFLTGKVLPFEVVTLYGNILLSEGITEVLTLAIGGGGTAFSAANARIGVGNGTSGESASQTGLQGATKTFKAMEAGYPQVSGSTVTFRSQFTELEANHAWEEFTVVNAADDTGDNLNRKVSSQGTKTSGQVWTITLQVTFT